MSDRRRPQEDKVTPALANVEAERFVLAKILQDDRVWFDVADRLKPEHFTDARNRAVFSAMQALSKSGKPITRQLVPGQMSDMEADGVTLVAFLAALAAQASDLTVSDFVDEIVEAAQRRRGIQEAERLIDELRQARHDGTVREVLRAAERRFANIDDEGDDDAPLLGAVAERVAQRTNDLWNADKAAGLRTGLRCVDDLLGSIMPGQVVTLGGLTASGKTALAVEMGILIAQQGTAVHMFSLEMEATEIATRVLATFAEISAEKITEALISHSEMENVINMARRTRGIPFYIDARPKPNVMTIQTRAARAQAKNNAGLLIIDHLQYVRPDNPRADERERVAQVADDIKAMAKRLQIPVLLLSHLNRYVDSSTTRTLKDIRRPALNHLYGSSAIEKASDAVLFVHRPWAILQDVKPAEGHKDYATWEGDCLISEGKAEIILAKRRSGKGRGIRTCEFDDRLTWFRDVRKEEPKQEEVTSL